MQKPGDGGYYRKGKTTKTWDQVVQNDLQHLHLNSQKTATDGEMLSRRYHPTHASMERMLNNDDDDDDDEGLKYL